MTLLTLLYKFFIGPLELFFEVVYMVTYRLIGDPALAIVILSLAMNFLVLPLYRRADAMQEEQRDLAIAMKPWSDHIKRTFKGDERFMMQQAYNRQMGYKQTDILKSSISLLLEIPFFIAAFHFLSNLELLNGVSLGPIANLGAPDALLSIGSTSINVLPILMTLINVVSAFIYLKGFPLSSKIQTYGIAAIFLVLLYNSPAGLVFYWTLNNLFSLVKNIFYKLRNPKKVLAILASIAGVAILFAVVIARTEMSLVRGVVLAVAVVGLQVPLLTQLRKGKSRPLIQIPEATQATNRSFFLGCLFLALLVGLFIPLSVIQASPAEFVNTTAYKSPLWIVAESLALSLGTFVLWFGVFYWLATPKGKTIFSFLVFAAAGTAIVNYLFFGTSYGNISSYLKYDSPPEISSSAIGVNLAIMAVAIGVLFAVWKKLPKVAQGACASLCVAVTAFAIYSAVGIEANLAPIKQDTLRATAAAQQTGQTEQAEQAEQAGQETAPDSPTISLSKMGKNVVVIMLDRAIPGFVPYMMYEKPELKKMFSGFTVYTNAISYGTHTNVGNVAIWGGQDYRPVQMNERSELQLVEKQNEALKVMPRLFADAGYSNTVFDPPFAGYRWISDLNIYEDVPNTSAYITQDGQFWESNVKTPEGRAYEQSQRAHSFFCYGLFRTSPLALSHIIYQGGGYNSTKPLIQVDLTRSVALGYNPDFMNSYSVLESMPEITSVTNTSEGSFLMMENDATHGATVLKEPEYSPVEYVDNTAFDLEHDVRRSELGDSLVFSEGSPAHASARTTHYEINMASFFSLGKWFEYLKEQGVYDNTRIILVSDHSWPYVFDDSLYFAIADHEGETAYYRDPRAFSCLLMVKDFDSKAFTYDDSFMTTADVPVMAMDGIINNPINPYTGNSIDSSYKSEPKQFVLDSDNWDIGSNNGEVFLPGRWFAVQDDPSKKQNWEYLGFY